MEDEQNCAVCGMRIVLMRYALGDQWVHQPSGSAFHDNVERYCHTTVATPEGD